MKQLVVGALVILFFSGCAVFVVTPNPRVESPEVRGERGFKIGMDITGANTYESSPDGSTRPPDITHPNVNSSQTANAAFAWSPATPIEIGAELSPVQGAGAAAVLRWQILGEGTRTAEAGNIPLGVYVRAGDSYTHSNGNQDGLFGPGGYKWSANLNSGYVHSGISAGYRFNSHVLAYAGGAFGQYWNASEINQDKSDKDNGGVYKANDTGRGLTGGGGALFNWHSFQFYVGAEYSDIRYHRAGASYGTSFRGGFVFTP